MGKRHKTNSVEHVKKKDKKWKEHQVLQICDAISKYPRLFIFRHNSIKNYNLKEFRGSLRDKGKFYVGSCKVAKIAFKRERKKLNRNLFKDLHLIKGNTALF